MSHPTLWRLCLLPQVLDIFKSLVYLAWQVVRWVPFIVIRVRNEPDTRAVLNDVRVSLWMLHNINNNPVTVIPLCYFPPAQYKSSLSLRPTDSLWVDGLGQVTWSGGPVVPLQPPGGVLTQHLVNWSWQICLTYKLVLLSSCQLWLSRLLTAVSLLYDFGVVLCVRFVDSLSISLYDLKFVLQYTCG